MAIHNLLKVCSVLPALLVMPAMAAVADITDVTADNANLNTVFTNGVVSGAIHSTTGVAGTLNTQNISIVADAMNTVYANGAGSQLVIGGADTKTLSITSEDTGASPDGYARAVRASNGGNVTLNADDINIDIKATEHAPTVYAMQARGPGSSIVVNAKNLNIKSDYAGILAQNADNKTPVATVDVTADNIDVEAKVGLVGFAQGILTVEGNTKIKAVVDAIAARGDSQVIVNKSGKNTVQMDGDINFTYHEGTSKTNIDALVDVTLAGEKSYWNGNTIVTYDKKPAAEKLAVSKAVLTLKDGATWNATKIDDNTGDVEGLYYTALNELNINDGNVNIADKDRGITVDVVNATDADFTGGKLVITDTFTGTDVDFENAKSTGNGGAIYNTGKLTIDNGDFDNNEAYYGGAIASNVTNGEKVTITNSTFEGNKAHYDYPDYGPYGDGGALSLQNGEVEIKKTSFLNNTSDWGGAIYAYTGNNHFVKVLIEDSEFKGNSALSAGAIKNDATDQKNPGGLTVLNTKFVENHATGTAEVEGGGAMHLGAQSLTWLENVTFSGNTAVSRGGAIVTRETIDPTDNKAKNNKDSQFDIVNSTFIGNVATGKGGAIYNTFYNDKAGNAYASVVGTTFDKNSAANGGAIYNDGSLDLNNENGAMKFTDSVFTNNTATENGGAIYNEADADIFLAGTNTFSGNTANEVANDIHNLGTVTIESGTTTIKGGITGDTGTLTIAEDATLNMGISTIEQGTLTLNGVINADLQMNGRAPVFAKLLADTIDGTGTLNLNVSSVGTYDIFKEGVTFDTITIAYGDSTKVFDVSLDGNKIVAKTKSVAEIAQKNNLTDSAASVVAGLTQSDNAAAAAISLAVQRELAAGNTEYVEQQMANANPDEAPVTQSVAAATQGVVLNLAAGRMGGAISAGRAGGEAVEADYGMWAQGLFNKSKLNGKFHGYTRGFAIGADALIDKVWTVGVGAAFNNSDVHANGGRNTDIDTTSLFVYGQYKPAAWYVNATLNYTMSDYTENGSVMGTLVQSDYDTDSFGGQLMAGYDMSFGLTPEAGVRYLHINDYKQNALTSAETESSDYLTAVAGAKYAFTLNMPIKNDADLIVWRPELRAAATYDMVSEAGQSLVSMPGVNSYLMGGQRLSRFGGEFGLGVAMLYHGLEVSVNYEMNLHEDYTSQTGMLKFRYDF